MMMRTVLTSSTGMKGTMAAHVNIFELNPIASFDTGESHVHLLKPMENSHGKSAFAFEPDTGLNPTQPNLQSKTTTTIKK